MTEAPLFHQVGFSLEEAAGGGGTLVFGIDEGTTSVETTAGSAVDLVGSVTDSVSVLADVRSLSMMDDVLSWVEVEVSLICERISCEMRTPDPKSTSPEPEDITEVSASPTSPSSSSSSVSFMLVAAFGPPTFLPSPSS